VTGRERRRSELEKAEEGDSPFRDSFEDEDEKGGWIMKRRKRSQEPEHMV
jgi:hypothetical protein